MKFARIFFIFSLSLAFIGVGCNKPSQPVQPEQIPVADNLPKNTEDQKADNLNVVEQPVEEPVFMEQTIPGSDENDMEVKNLPDEEVKPEPQIRTFDITAKQWEFIPASITVNQGDIVRINVTSTDVDHGFVISAFGVNVEVNASQTEHVEFVADKKGTYTIFCSVFCGTGHGNMKGTLIVE